MLSRFDQRSLHLETGLDQNFLGTTTWWLASKIFYFGIEHNDALGGNCKVFNFWFYLKVIFDWHEVNWRSQPKWPNMQCLCKGIIYLARAFLETCETSQSQLWDIWVSCLWSKTFIKTGTCDAHCASQKGFPINWGQSESFKTYHKPAYIHGCSDKRHLTSVPSLVVGHHSGKSLGFCQGYFWNQHHHHHFIVTITLTQPPQYQGQGQARCRAREGREEWGGRRPWFLIRGGSFLLQWWCCFSWNDDGESLVTLVTKVMFYDFNT